MRLKVISRKFVPPRRFNNATRNNVLALSPTSVLGSCTLAIARAAWIWHTLKSLSPMINILCMWYVLILTAIPKAEREREYTRRTFSLSSQHCADGLPSLTAEFVKCGENNYNQPRQSHSAPLLPVACKYDCLDERTPTVEHKRPKPQWKMRWSGERGRNVPLSKWLVFLWNSILRLVDLAESALRLQAIVKIKAEFLHQQFITFLWNIQ